MKCKHCGRLIEGGHHIEGQQRLLMRCWPADSNLPYGYNAEPVGEPCTEICLGSMIHGIQ